MYADNFLYDSALKAKQDYDTVAFTQMIDQNGKKTVIDKYYVISGSDKIAITKEEYKNRKKEMRKRAE